MPQDTPRLHGYMAFLNGKQIEVHAESLWAAKQRAVALLKPKKREQHMVSVVLCEKDGERVGINPAML